MDKNRRKVKYGIIAIIVCSLLLVGNLIFKVLPFSANHTSGIFIMFFIFLFLVQFRKMNITNRTREVFKDEK